MTQNQIAYHNAQETKRHNLAAEQELNRHQLMQEALSRWANALTNYQIAVNNAHYKRMDAETERANRAREAQNQTNLGLNAQSIAETQRANVANEYIKQRSNEIQAANVAETSRHQKAMEGIQQSLNSSLIEKYEAETGYTDERTKSEGVYRTYVLPSQAELNTSSAGLNKEKMQTEYTQRFMNVMSGFGAGARAIKDLGGLAVDLVTAGSSRAFTNSPTEADSSRNFWSQLEVLTRK